MRKFSDNSVFQYALIACLSVALLLGQTVKLHMHVQHDEVSSANAVINDFSANHIVNIHVSSLRHTALDNHHQNDFPDHHNNANIDVSSDGVLKISKVLNLFVFLLLVISFALFVPFLQRISKTQFSQIISPTKYYLLLAPLRAPPI